MSSHTIVANMTKKQYLNPEIFYDPGDLSRHYLFGNHARAVAFLVCDGGCKGASCS